MATDVKWSNSNQLPAKTCARSFILGAVILLLGSASPERSFVHVAIAFASIHEQAPRPERGGREQGWEPLQPFEGRTRLNPKVTGDSVGLGTTESSRRPYR